MDKYSLDFYKKLIGNNGFTLEEVSRVMSSLGMKVDLKKIKNEMREKKLKRILGE